MTKQSQVVEKPLILKAITLQRSMDMLLKPTIGKIQAVAKQFVVANSYNPEIAVLQFDDW